MSLVRAVEVPRQPVARLEPVIGDERHARLARAAGQFRPRLAGRTIWNVNSTAAGGGVAEMLQVLLGYVAGSGIRSRWLVIAGDAGFFEITKRLHNHLHGRPAGGPLGEAEAGHYAEMLRRERGRAGSARCGPATSCCCTTRRPPAWPEPLARAGARVVWRCHIGVDWANDATRARVELPAAVPGRRGSLRLLPPPVRAGVDAGRAGRGSSRRRSTRSPRRTRTSTMTPCGRILATVGVLDGAAPAAARDFVRSDGSRAPSPGQRRSSARAAPAPVIRSWSRCPAGTGSRTWPG